MSVRKHISKTSRDVRSSSNFRCTRPWLGLPLAALRYGLQRYVRFVDGVLFSHNGAYAYTHLPHTVAAACVSCWPVSGTSRLAYTTATKCAVEAKYAVYDCLVAIPLTAPGGQVTHTTTSYKPPPSAWPRQANSPGNFQRDLLGRIACTLTESINCRCSLLLQIRDERKCS